MARSRDEDWSHFSGLMVAAIVLAMANCQPTFVPLDEPSSGKYSPTSFGESSPLMAHTPTTLVNLFNDEMQRNEFRVRDWPGTEVVRLRLNDVAIGDGIVTYDGGKYILPWRTNSLKVTCRFADSGESRTINNGDIVDLEGRVAVAERKWVRVVIELSPCYRIRYEN